jgi:CRP-like cAMP-binding protein
VSVLEELQGLEDRVRTRMRELTPLVAEYKELQQVAQRLGVKADSPQSAKSRTRRRHGSSSAATASRAPSTNSGKKAAARTSSNRARARSARSGRQPGGPGAGQREQQLLALVQDSPGITVRQIGEELGVDPTSLYRVVKRLEQQGALTKRGRELQAL